MKQRLIAAIREVLRPVAEWALAPALTRLHTGLGTLATQARVSQQDAERAYAIIDSLKAAPAEMAEWARSPKCPEGATAACISWAEYMWWLSCGVRQSGPSQFGIVCPFKRWGIDR